MPSVYCTSPWTGLFIHTDGKVKSCCAGTWEWGDLNTTPLDQILRDPRVVEIRQEMLAGQIPAYCTYCKDAESTSGSSQRQYYDQFTLEEDQLSDSTTFELQTVDIRWNTLCNLKCVYCDERWSTTWQQAKNIPIKPMYFDYYTTVLNYIQQNAATMKSAMLAGGEPLLHKQNIRLLEELDQSVTVDLITNLSVPLAQSPVFDVLKQRTNVRWHVSMDNVGSQFEYVRNGANWEQIKANIVTLRRIPGHLVTIFPVFNIYTVTNLVDYYNFARAARVSIHWQKLQFPAQLNVSNFSEPVRQLAREKIQQVLDNPVMVGYVHGDEFLKHLEKQLAIAPERERDSEFRAWTAEYETKYTTGKFSKLWSELDSIIKK